MTGYKLIRLAPGSYDVVLNGLIIASLVKSETPSRVGTWTVELLQHVPPEQRPAPFTELEHQFSTREEALAWLGHPVIQGEG